jgi:dipeptidyl aminopeptidase
MINGICDWVYEEEVFGSNVALWFSPDASRIAYLKFNESLVPTYKMHLHETPRGSYPREISIRYPKAGFPNPVVSLRISTTTDDGSDVAVVFEEGDAFADDNRLIVEVKWLDNEMILVRLMNRVQDHQRVFIVSPEDNAMGKDQIWFGFFILTVRRAKLVRDETNSDLAWFNILQPTTLVKPHISKINRLTRQNPSYIEMKEDATGFTHLAYYRNIYSSEPNVWLTSGDWEVTKIVGVNEKTGVVYYIATDADTGDSTQRHLYSVSLLGARTYMNTPENSREASPDPSFTLPDDVSERKNENIVTTRISKRNVLNRRTVIREQKASREAGMYNAIFTPKCEFYVLEYLGPDIPYSKAIEITNGLSSPLIKKTELRNGYAILK